MRSAYLFLVASAAFVTCKPQRNNNDIIWFPVDNEDGVFISLYGEKHRTPSGSKGGSHRRARYSDVNDYVSYISPPDNEDPSFFHNIHERRPFGQQNPYQQYNQMIPQGFRPVFNGHTNQQLVNFENDRAPHRPDYEGLNDDNLQQIYEIFDFNKLPSVNRFPGRRPSSDNNMRPSANQVFMTTTTRPFQRPTNNEWLVTSKPTKRPGVVRPNRPNTGSESFVFPSETPNVRPTATPTSQLPTEMTTLSTCERRCPVTPEFNPVCGSDSFTYSNHGRLKCAQACGKGVKLAHFGNCGRSRSVKHPPPAPPTLIKLRI